MDEPVILLQHVKKSFKIGDSVVTALNDINLEIGAGLNALMGPSGSGKSTLLNLIGALDSPDSGEIKIAGTALSSLNPSERAQFRNRRCGFIFQNFNLIPVLSAIENVVLPAQLSKDLNKEDPQSRGLTLLRAVGLEHQADQMVNRLSGGQMQRVAIARALMNDPAVILADEPTANLDQQTAGSIMKLLKTIATANRTSVVIATHDHSVIDFCERVIRVRDGQILN
jgi:putative ABC transport system ATP-binding protein